MVCLKEKTLHVYLDGELEPALREKIARHLEDCPRCRELAWRRLAFDIALSTAAATVPDEAHLDDAALAAYLARQLDDTARDEAERHLAGCHVCRRCLVETVRREDGKPAKRPSPPSRRSRAPRRRRRCLRKRVHRKR